MAPFMRLYEQMFECILSLQLWYMQAIDGQRAGWFKCWRSTKSGNSTGNEFEGCPNEEGMRTLAYINFTPAIHWSMYK